MCQASNEDGSSPSGPLRRFASHERLAEWRSQAGSYLKGNRSGSPKVMQDKGIQAEVQAPPRFLFSAIMVLACCVALNQVGLFVPLVMITRNCVLPKFPRTVQPKYPTCSDAMLGDEMTIVVSVKDACSQAPGSDHLSAWI